MASCGGSRRPPWRHARAGPRSRWPPQLAGVGAPPAADPELGAYYDTEWSRRYPVRLARAVVLDNVARPAGPGAGLAIDPGRRGTHRSRGPGDLRRQPRQPRRRPAAVELPPTAVSPSHGGGGGGRLLLRPAVEGRRLVVPPGRHPHRTDQGQPPVGRAGLGAAGRRMEPDHLPRGRALARRMGTGIHRRGRLSRLTYRLPGRAGASRRHPPHPAQGRQGRPPDPDHHRLRHPAVAGGRRARPPFRRAHRGRGGHHGQRVRLRLVDRPQAGGVGYHASPPGSERRCLATVMDVVGSSCTTRSGRRRGVAEAQHAGPALSVDCGSASATDQPGRTAGRRGGGGDASIDARRSSRRASSSASSRGSSEPGAEGEMAQPSSRSARAVLRARTGPCR